MEIRVDRLRFSYNASPIIDGIDMTVRKGEVLAIVGANGSGKTTLLKNVSGTLTPKTGAVYLDMRRLADLSPAELACCLTVVEQEREVGFDFTVREIVALGRIPHRSRFARENEIDRRSISMAMELADITPFAERSIRTLSGGEKQRVFLAVALAQDPRVLLLDEPTTHLDITHQIQIMEIVRRQAAAGLAVLIAVHDLNLAAQYADRVAILHQGRLVAVGRPEQVLTTASIKKAFSTDVIVGRNPLTNSIYISPIPQKPIKQAALGKLHIVCGGGSGVPVLHALSARFSLSVGVVSLLDSDFQAARHLGARIVMDAPFAPISAEAHEENLEVMRASDGVVVCATPFGPGNLRNLTALLQLEKRIDVYILDPEGIETRDYTGGEATGLIHRLLRSGAVAVNTIDELSRLITAGKTADHISSVPRPGERTDSVAPRAGPHLATAWLRSKTGGP
ncbi:heme ABC transporter ATP-binding protein [Candidatus Bipolaricaulota bacterium]|nr:heme ABC transporter ATP-binding protein [Candidatus Bipolaricaulota bacterium]